MSNPIRGRVVLLGVQGFLLGLTSALLIIPVSAIFLARYGSARLPYTYLAVAVLGVLVSLRLATVIRRLSLIRLAVLTLGTAALAYGLSWVLLRTIDAVWTSFALWVVFPLQLQLGFVFIGSQAGRLLDVRQIKRYFPRVVFGFSAGFLVGGIGTIPLAGRIAPADMLLLTTASGVALVIAFLVSGRRYRTELAEPASPPSGATDLPNRPRSILRDRYVALVFGYQVLTAAVGQVTDFLAFDRAAARYDEAGELASFAAVLTAVVNIADILFLALVAGFVMTRFGLRLGMMLNPLATAALTVTMLFLGATAGTASTAFFLLAATTRVLNIVLTDGTSRTSINAAYQAVAPDRRFAAQSAVEGIGVPIGLGLVGVLLIAVDAAGAGPMVVTAAMGILCLLWLLSGVSVFADYRKNLAVRLRRRQISPVDLESADADTRRFATEAVTSWDPHRIAVGLDVLAASRDRGLGGLLAELLEDDDPERILVALSRLGSEPGEALLTRVGALVASDDPAVRQAAATALRRSGAGERAAATVRAWAAAPDPASRRIAARVLAAGTIDPGALEVLKALRGDPDSTVRLAAVEAAAGEPGSDANALLVAAMLSGPADPTLVPALARMLAAQGDTAAGIVDAGLRGEGPAAVLPRWRLARCAAGFSPAAAHGILGPLLAAPDPALRRASRHALLESGWRGELPANCLEADRERAVALLGATAALQPIEPGHVLVRSLAEALAAHTDDVAVAADITVHEPVASRWVEVVRSGVGDVAIAEEAAEVTFSGEQRRLLGALLHPGFEPAARLALLDSMVPSAEEAVLRLVEGQGAHADPWLRVAAVWWVGSHPTAVLRTAVAAVRSDDPILAETAAGVLAA